MYPYILVRHNIPDFIFLAFKHVNKKVTVVSCKKTVSIINTSCAIIMLNIQKSKNTVLILNIPIITFLNFVFYTLAASILASRPNFTRPRPGPPRPRPVHEAEARLFGLEA